MVSRLPGELRSPAAAGLSGGPGCALRLWTGRGEEAAGLLGQSLAGQLRGRGGCP